MLITRQQPNYALVVDLTNQVVDDDDDDISVTDSTA
jgi:hypothetical protein